MKNPGLPPGQSIMGPVARHPPLDRAKHRTGHAGQWLAVRCRELDERGIALSFSAKVTTRLTWPCPEGIPQFLRGRGWVAVCGHTCHTQGALESYVENWSGSEAPPLVARLVAAAGIIEAKLGPPLQVRLLPVPYGWGACSP